MEIEKILKMKGSEKDILSFILSNACDIGSSRGAMISLKAFDKLSDNLIKWKEGACPQTSIEPRIETKLM